MMKNAKAIAGEDGTLVVGILTDKAIMEKKPKPAISFDERMSIAQAIRYADVVVPQEEYSPISNIKRIRPDILVESSSHSEKDIEEARKIMESMGGKVIVMPYYPSQSSTNIKNSIKEGGPPQNKLKICRQAAHAT